MYDEFDNKENEDRYPADGEPEYGGADAEVYGDDNAVDSKVYEEDAAVNSQARTEDTAANQTYADASAGTEKAGDMADDDTAQESAQQSSVYHYTYEKGEQAEQTHPENHYQSGYQNGDYQQSNGYSQSGSQQNGEQAEDNRQYRQYYQDGQYHQRETGWKNGVYGNHEDKSFRPVKRGGDKKPGGGLGKKFGICAALAVVFGLVASVTFQAANAVGNKAAGSNETEARVELQTQEAAQGQTEAANSGNTQAAAVGSADITAVAENAMPSIVAITNKGVEEVQSLFFGTTQYQETESSGSGVIIAKNDKELLIATNNHVVDGAEELSVCFTVETENAEDAVVTAQVKGTDSDHDLAVVAVNLSDISEDVQSKLKVAVMGDSDKIKVGTQVVAIGNALGYGQSVTVGYVSALNREVTIDGISNNMLQTDAAINFGNSGGALLDTAGNLIGINSAKAADTGVEGMGYALPVNTASPILDELMNRTTRSKVTDSAELGFLGVDPRDVSEEARQIYNLPAGAFVYSVVEGSPAEKAGIKKGDIITKLDGITISSRDELFSRMEYYKAGESIDVVVKTAEGGDYVERTVSVTLAKKSDFSSESGSDSKSGSDSDSGLNPDSGDSGQDQPDQYYDGNGREGNGGDEYNGGDYYDSLEDFFRQFQQ